MKMRADAGFTSELGVSASTVLVPISGRASRNYLGSITLSVSHDQHRASNDPTTRPNHPARGNRWATGAERVRDRGNILVRRVRLGGRPCACSAVKLDLQDASSFQAKIVAYRKGRAFRRNRGLVERSFACDSVNQHQEWLSGSQIARVRFSRLRAA
jgi:hypothetical protein